MREIVEICSISQCLRILLKFLDPDSDADNFLNLVIYSCLRIRLWCNFHEVFSFQ